MPDDDESLGLTHIGILLHLYNWDSRTTYQIAALMPPPRMTGHLQNCIGDLVSRGLASGERRQDRVFWTITQKGRFKVEEFIRSGAL